jgi:hypothetical protein
MRFISRRDVFSFCRICPASAIQVTLRHMPRRNRRYQRPITIKLGLLAGILLLATASSRSFCKTLCPSGRCLRRSTNQRGDSQAADRSLYRLREMRPCLPTDVERQTHLRGIPRTNLDCIYVTSAARSARLSQNSAIEHQNVNETPYGNDGEHDANTVRSHHRMAPVHDAVTALPSAGTPEETGRRPAHWFSSLNSDRQRDAEIDVPTVFESAFTMEPDYEGSDSYAGAYGRGGRAEYIGFAWDTRNALSGSTQRNLDLTDVSSTIRSQQKNSNNHFSVTCGSHRPLRENRHSFPSPQNSRQRRTIRAIQSARLGGFVTLMNRVRIS